MKPEELKQELNRGVLRPAYLLYGEEPYLIRHYAQRLSALVLADDQMQDFNAYRTEEADEEQITRFLQTPPVFAEKKLLFLRQTGLFKSPRADQKEFLLKMLSDLPEYVCVIFEEREIDKKQKKLLAAVTAVECNCMTEAQLKTWIGLLFRQQKKKISVGTMEHLLTRCGNGMLRLEQEIGKLANLPGETVTAEQIDEIVPQSPENQIFELSRAVLARQFDRAMRILRDLKALEKNSDKKLRANPVQIVAILSKNFCDLYKIKHTSNPTPQSMGLHPYVLKLHTQTARRESDERLERLISLTAECDLALKSSAVSSWLLLEECVAKCLQA